MRKYHGCAGFTIHELARFIKNRHALVSFAEPDHLYVAADYCSSFVLDNGAFTIWRQGGKMDVDKYLSWVYEWYRHPGFDWAIIPDIIEGDEKENNALIDAWPVEVPGVPVWHTYESLEKLEWLAEEFTTVAIGTSGKGYELNNEAFWRRMDEAMKVVCDELGRPTVHLHGLRMLDPVIFQRLPLSSADSSNCATNSGDPHRFKVYRHPSRAFRAMQIAGSFEEFNSAPVWAFDKQTKLFTHP